MKYSFTPISLENLHPDPAERVKTGEFLFNEINNPSIFQSLDRHHFPLEQRRFIRKCTENNMPILYLRNTGLVLFCFINADEDFISKMNIQFRYAWYCTYLSIKQDFMALDYSPFNVFRLTGKEELKKIFRNDTDYLMNNLDGQALEDFLIGVSLL